MCIRDRSSSEVGELELKGKSVPGLTGGVSELELIGVFVHLVDPHNSGDNVEIGVSGLGLVEGSVHIPGDTVVVSEPVSGPGSEVAEDLSLVLLEGWLLSREGAGDEVSVSGIKSVLLISGEEGPGTVPLGGDVELSVVLVESEGSPVDSQDIANSVHNGEVFESLGVDDNGSEVVVAGLGTLSVERVVDDLDGADVLVLVDLVGDCLLYTSPSPRDS